MPATLNQQTADGARGGAAARKTNCHGCGGRPCKRPFGGDSPLMAEASTGWQGQPADGDSIRAGVVAGTSPRDEIA